MGKVSLWSDGMKQKMLKIIIQHYAKYTSHLYALLYF